MVKQIKHMMAFFALILIVIWLVCISTGTTFGGFINILLVLAVLLALMQMFFKGHDGGEGDDF